MIRRCLSFLNRLAGKPHRPREPEIRDILQACGIEWSEEASAEKDEAQEDGDQEEAEAEEEGEEEGEEEEAAEEDEEVVPG